MRSVTERSLLSFFLLVVGLLAFSLGAISASHAATNFVSVGPEFSLTADAGATSPVVGVSSSIHGQFVVVWRGTSPSGRVARRFALDGTPLGQEFFLEGAADSRPPSSVAVAPDGSFAVARMGSDVVVSAFDSVGTPKGAPFSPGPDPSNYERRDPYVAADSASGFVVVWSSEDVSGGYLGYNTNIVARRLGPSALPLGAQVVVGSGYVPDHFDEGFESVRSPAVTNSGGEFVVVWESVQDSYFYGDASSVSTEKITSRDFSLQPRSWGSGSQRARSSGSAALGVDVSESVSSGSRSSRGSVAARGSLPGSEEEHFEAAPKVASDAFGNDVVVWTESSACSTGSEDEGGPEGCYFRYDGIGLQAFPDLPNLAGKQRVNAFDNEGQRDAKVAMSPSGDFVVVWTSGSTPSPGESDKTAPAQDGDGDGVFLRPFDCAGNALGDGDIQVNQWTTGAQNLPQVAVSASGHALVTWNGGPQGRPAARVFRFDPPCPLCGDADGSGDLLATDALIALRASVDLVACPLRRCDVNADTVVTTQDALSILIQVIGGDAEMLCDRALPGELRLGS